MKFFLDENIPKNCANFLIAERHSIIDIRGTLNEGLDDDTIFKMSQKENAIFLTTDKDFYHTIPHLYKFHYGVVVINLRQPNRNNILDKLKWALSNIDFNSFNSTILLMRDDNYTLLKKEL
jgi:predicted nuclease of predicted toxin-antitoxin system